MPAPPPTPAPFNSKTEDADDLLHPAAAPEHWFDRFSMLSDGVFAIAITLLAFDVHGPLAWNGGLRSLWSYLLPQLDAFALSVVVISAYWLAHRRFVAMLHAVDAPTTIINLVLLALVALLPAATKLAESHHAAPPDMLIYAALVVAIGLAMSTMWAYAALISDLVEPRIPLRVRWFLLVLMVFTPPLFLGVIELIPDPGPGAIPGVLVALFLVGWRMRLWVLARLMRSSATR